MEFLDSLAVESWILWVLGVFVVACRLIARRMKLGKWSRLAIEDYLMVFALVNFTGVVVCINEVAKNGSNYMPEETAKALSPEGVDQAIFGSIMTFVLEIFTLTAVWTVKACLLLLYFRLTEGTSIRQQWGVRFVAGYCVLTYVLVTFLFVFYWCSPHTTEYWAVPVRIDQCASYYNHMIFATACNISSDLMLLLIPIPIMIKIRLPMKRKIGLCCVFGLGLFNILAAVLNRYYNFTNPNSYVFLYWYVAEVGVAMYVGNLPLCWPVIRLAIGSKGDSSNPSYPNPSYPNPSHPNSTNRFKSQSRHPLTSKASIWAKLDDEDGLRTVSAPDSGSQIELVDQNIPDLVKQPYHTAAEVSSHPSHGHRPGEHIMVTTNVDVSTKTK
ncbi:Fc.00g027570.m01.CDS01 [Cosmosporella sp. VM-42]